MALNKNGMDLKAIAKDQKAIDKLPNKGRASVDHSKAESRKKEMAKKIKTEPLNAWGQDPKTAKEVRKQLKKEKSFKAFGKHSSERFNAGY